MIRYEKLMKYPSQSTMTRINQILAATTSFLMSLRITNIEKRLTRLEMLHVGEAPYFDAAHTRETM